jgi:hypothetical protein
MGVVLVMALPDLRRSFVTVAVLLPDAMAEICFSQREAGRDAIGKMVMEGDG